jgi:hypothetical protein
MKLNALCKNFKLILSCFILLLQLTTIQAFASERANVDVQAVMKLIQVNNAADEDDGKCDFNSDCAQGACHSGKCSINGGGCDFNSDCGGFGKCVNGTCSSAPNGQCHFNSDCSSGSCINGQCSIVGGGCNFNSDCPKGKKCDSGKCKRIR